MLLSPGLKVVPQGPKGQGKASLCQVVVAEAEHLPLSEFHLVLLPEDPAFVDEPLDQAAHVTKRNEADRTEGMVEAAHVRGAVHERQGSHHAPYG